jgi:UDP-3-O-[3-hydroxymyristoyl] glucosamine N-acyltransferase
MEKEHRMEKEHGMENEVETEKKYELTEAIIEHEGVRLYRIKALRDFSDVKKGDLGGYIEKEANLSHYGNCWVGGNAYVYANADVSDNAQVYDDARFGGRAWVYNDARVYGNARVWGNARFAKISQRFYSVQPYALVLDYSLC